MSKFFKSLIKEEIARRVQEAECYIETSTGENLTDILTAIRSIAGVTIVNLVGSSRKVSEQKEAAILKIKFIPVSATLDTFVKALVLRIRNLNGVYSFHIKNMENYMSKVQRQKEKRKLTMGK